MMNKEKKFINFLESLKTKNPKLIESLETGFKTCFEAEGPKLDYVDVSGGASNSTLSISIHLESMGYYRTLKQDPEDDDNDIIEPQYVDIEVERAGEDCHSERIFIYRKKLSPTQTTKEEFKNMLEKESIVMSKDIDGLLDALNMDIRDVFGGHNYEDTHL